MFPIMNGAFRPSDHWRRHISSRILCSGEPGDETVPEDEILTIEELAAYLKLKPQTVCRWAQTGKVPAAKLGKEWRFRRSLVDAWIDEQMTGGRPTGDASALETAADADGRDPTHGPGGN